MIRLIVNFMLKATVAICLSLITYNIYHSTGNIIAAVITFITLLPFAVAADYMINNRNK